MHFTRMLSTPFSLNSRIKKVILGDEEISFSLQFSTFFTCLVEGWGLEWLLELEVVLVDVSAPIAVLPTIFFG